MSKRPPSTLSTSFDCPHCGVFTSQTWLDAYGSGIRQEPRLPNIPSLEYIEKLKSKISQNEASRMPEDMSAHKVALSMAEKMYSGFPVQYNFDARADFKLANLFFSRCYDCKKISIWLHRSLIFPADRIGPPPAHDLPDSIKTDYEEARSIVRLSPRGAAALLRLCVQKLCIELGEPGERIDTDIASLVAKGLNPMVQIALDSVRVIGNEAVHPGQMDLKDDYAIAEELFLAINFIVDQTITSKRKLTELYDRLPEEKRKGIDSRNARALDGKGN